MVGVVLHAIRLSRLLKYGRILAELVTLTSEIDNGVRSLRSPRQRRERMYCGYSLVEPTYRDKRRAFRKHEIDAAHTRDEGICAWCDSYVPRNECVGDHITPWAHGGRTTVDNCQPMHASCNREKRDQCSPECFAA